mmetsp:Transcript_6301/g.9153  ORF Transcript_6301/g.9153 Transcript_6301/m.9153 type:complete len:289 (+) Transcript_6301:70-936(+)
MFAKISPLLTSLSSHTPPGLVLSLSSAFIVDKKYLSCYRNEFVGTLLMIACTFSAGKWIGEDNLPLAWTAHAVGVVAADYFGGGQHVNPAVSVAMWSLGKCDYTEMYIRIAGAMGGGLVAFPLFRSLSDYMEWNALGGPEFNPLDDDDGSSSAFSEFLATFLLCVAIYVLNWELNFGKFHYWIKQTLTALFIRYLIEMFPTAGPAINPMLGTTWAVFASAFSDDEKVNTGIFPEDPLHYFVYWVAPILGALLASFCYVVYAGGTFLGSKIPLGQIKPVAVVTESKKKK